MKRLLPWLLIIGCKDITFTKEVPPLYISAQLVVGDTIQYIFVDVPRKPEEPRGKGLNDAYVQVTCGDSVYVFSPVWTDIRVIGEFQQEPGVDSVYLYISKFSPKPLTRCSLLVIRGKDTARATTLTPDTFSLILLKINPDSSITFVSDTVRLPEDSSVIAIWQKVKEGYFYFAYVYNYDKRDSVLLTRPNRYLFVPIIDSALISGIADSLRGFPPFMFYKDPAFSWGDGNYAVKVWALNEDRYKWTLYNEGNIENAVGIFASVSQSLKIVYVKFR